MDGVLRINCILLLFFSIWFALSSAEFASLEQKCPNDLSNVVQYGLTKNIKNCFKFHLDENKIVKRKRKVTIFINDTNPEANIYLMCFHAQFPHDKRKVWGSVNICAGEESNCDNYLYAGYSERYSDCTAVKNVKSGRFTITYLPPSSNDDSENMSVKVLVMRTVAYVILFEEIDHSSSAETKNLHCSSSETKQPVYKCSLSVPESPNLQIFGTFIMRHECGKQLFLLKTCLDKNYCSTNSQHSCNSTQNRILCEEKFTKEKSAFDIKKEYLQEDDFQEDDLQEDDLQEKATWGPWSKLTECSVSCGAGQYIKTRGCTIPLKCEGLPVSEESCNKGLCPVSGGLQDIWILSFTLIVLAIIIFVILEKKWKLISTRYTRFVNRIKVRFGMNIPSDSPANEPLNRERHQ